MIPWAMKALYINRTRESRGALVLTLYFLRLSQSLMNFGIALLRVPGFPSPRCGVTRTEGLPIDRLFSPLSLQNVFKFHIPALNRKGKIARQKEGWRSHHSPKMLYLDLMTGRLVPGGI